MGIGCYPRCKPCGTKVTRVKTQTQTCATPTDQPLICCDDFWAAYHIQKIELGELIVVLFKGSGKILKGMLAGIDEPTGNVYLSRNLSPVDGNCTTLFNLQDVSAIGTCSPCNFPNYGPC